MQLHRATRPLPDDLKADVIHLHWVGRWLDLPSFLGDFQLEFRCVWTIHDMNPFAGGCFTYSGCERFMTGCLGIVSVAQDRPLISIWRPETFDEDSMRSRRDRVHAVREQPVYHVLLARRSRSVPQHAESFSTILPSLNPKDFVRREKRAAKKLLGIPENQFVLGVGAAVLTDENKGFTRFQDVAARVGSKISNVHADFCLWGWFGCQYLQRSTTQCFRSSVLPSSSELGLLGHGCLRRQLPGWRLWVRLPLRHRPAAHLFRAFDVGGLSDAVQDGRTGRLIPLGRQN